MNWNFTRCIGVRVVTAYTNGSVYGYQWVRMYGYGCGARESVYGCVLVCVRVPVSDSREPQGRATLPTNWKSDVSCHFNNHNRTEDC